MTRAPGLLAIATISLALATVAAALGACGDHDHAEPERDPQRQRRVIEPPTGTVRPLPPHAIRADGVGPYRLGESLDQLLKLLPSGPRIALYDIPGVVHRSIVRAEDDTVLIGGEPLAPASFVAVVGSEVARTESGIHVGSTKDELIRALGAPVTDPAHARDPRLIVPSGLRDLRAVLEGDRVVALVVVDGGGAAPDGSSAAGRRNALDEPDRSRPRAGAAPTAPSPAARDAGATPPPIAAVADPCPRPVPPPPVASGSAGSDAPAADPATQRFGACLTTTGELVEVIGDELSVRAPDGDHAIATTRVPGLQFAAALRADPDSGRDELVAIARIDEPAVRTWTLTVYRLDGPRLVRAVEPTQLYQLSTANARWIGAELRGLDLYLELGSRPDVIEVGGLLTIRIADKLRDVVVISPVPVPRHRGKVAADAVDAGVSDGAEPADAAGSDLHR